MNRKYMPLRLRRLSGQVDFLKPTQELPERVTLDSPAIMTMTDLRQVTALTVEPHVSIEWALARMRMGGVRLLLVTSPEGFVVGLITSKDIQGQKPLQILRQLNVRHAEIRVRDIMTPKSELECISLDEVIGASVGHVVETLRRSGRQHALVCECNNLQQSFTIRGIFSATRLSQQLGIQFEPIDMALGEMGAALTAG